jgi:benzodiazapine receptor
MDIASILVLFVFVGACFLAAATGALFPPGDWYERLAKPSWRPPNWLFAPLERPLPDYCRFRLAGVAEVRPRRRGLPLAIYLLQLVLNAAWTPIFFGLRRPDLVFFEIVVLWMAIVATIAIYYPIHAGAALLLVPYLAWVTFAAALNFSVWRLNQSRTSRK